MIRSRVHTTRRRPGNGVRLGRKLIRTLICAENPAASRYSERPTHRARFQPDRRSRCSRRCRTGPAAGPCGWDRRLIAAGWTDPEVVVVPDPRLFRVLREVLAVGTRGDRALGPHAADDLAVVFRLRHRLHIAGGHVALKAIEPPHEGPVSTENHLAETELAGPLALAGLEHRQAP